MGSARKGKKFWNDFCSLFPPLHQESVSCVCREIELVVKEGEGEREKAAAKFGPSRCSI